MLLYITLHSYIHIHIYIYKYVCVCWWCSHTEIKTQNSTVCHRFLLLSVQSYMALSTENGTPNYHQHCIYCDHIIFRWFITPIYQCLWHHIPVIFPRQTFSENAPKMSQNVMKIKCQSWSTSSFRCIIHILRLWQQINWVLSTNYMHHERRWKQPETYWYSSYYIWQDYVQLRKKCQNLDCCCGRHIGPQKK